MEEFKVSVIRVQEQVCTFSFKDKDVSSLREKLNDYDYLTEFFGSKDEMFDAGEVVNIFYEVRAIKKT